MGGAREEKKETTDTVRGGHCGSDIQSKPSSFSNRRDGEGLPPLTVCVCVCVSHFFFWVPRPGPLLHARSSVCPCVLSLPLCCLLLCLVRRAGRE